MASPLRVLLDGSALPARPAGAGVYTIELARSLAARSSIELTFASPRDTGTGVWMRTPAGFAGRHAWQLRAGSAASFDLIHGAHFAVPPRSRCPRVATVHDLTFFRIPQRYPAAHRWYYRSLGRLARRAERVIVPSSAVASDVVRYLGYPPERIRVIPEAPRILPSGHSGAETPSGPYLLAVGTAEPGKRAVDAIRALAAMPAEGRPPLVLAGHDGPLSAALRREARRLGVAGDVRFVGYVDNPTLGALLGNAVALLYPSLYEGFGLPPLEAMALGTPVIASRAPAMDEVLRDAAVLVPPRDPATIAREVTRLLTDPGWRAELSARGRERAASYSWDRTAEQTESVYRELA